MGAFCAERRPRGFRGGSLPSVISERSSPSAEARGQQEKVLLGSYEIPGRRPGYEGRVPCFLRAWFAYS